MSSSILSLCLCEAPLPEPQGWTYWVVDGEATLRSVCPAAPQAQGLLELYDSGGAAAMEAMEAPQLTWDQVRRPAPS